MIFKMSRRGAKNLEVINKNPKKIKLKNGMNLKMDQREVKNQEFLEAINKNPIKRINPKNGMSFRMIRTGVRNLKFLKAMVIGMT